MSINEDQNVVSSFGHVVDNTKEYIAPKSEAPQESKAGASKPEGDAIAAQQQGAAQQPEAAPEGGGGNDLLSSMAAQLSQITQQLNSPQSTDGGMEQGVQGGADDQLVQLNEQLFALQEQARNGEITYEEMIVQTAPIIEQRATINVQNSLAQQAQQRQVQDAQGQFLQQYPDFQQFAQSEEAHAIVQQNPVFDPVSAYFATREQKRAEENQLLQTQLLELQKQIQTSIKGAALNQGGIVGSETGDVGVPQLFRGDGLDQQKGGIAALRRARSATS